MNTDNKREGKETLKNRIASNNFNDMNALMNRFKEEDNRNSREMKFFKWLFLVMIIIYTALFVVNPDPSLGVPERISGLCFVGAFALFAVFFRKY